MSSLLAGIIMFFIEFLPYNTGSSLGQVTAFSCHISSQKNSLFLQPCCSSFLGLLDKSVIAWVPSAVEIYYLMVLEARGLSSGMSSLSIRLLMGSFFPSRMFFPWLFVSSPLSGFNLNILLCTELLQETFLPTPFLYLPFPFYAYNWVSLTELTWSLTKLYQFFFVFFFLFFFFFDQALLVLNTLVDSFLFLTTQKGIYWVVGVGEFECLTFPDS